MQYSKSSYRNDGPKIPDEVVQQVRDMWENGCTQLAICRVTKLSEQTVRRIIRNKIGHHWDPNYFPRKRIRVGNTWKDEETT